MEKIILVIFILIVALIWVIKANECIYEGDKVSTVATPIAIKFVKLIEKNGFPQSLDTLDGLSHKLISCKGKGNNIVEGCNKQEDRYFFVYKDEEYCILLSGGISDIKDITTLEIILNDTKCTYHIYTKYFKTGKGDVPLNYTTPDCSRHCGTTWWRQ